MAELLLGCGTHREKRIQFPDVPKQWVKLTTLDANPACEPDVLHTLGEGLLPFADNSFDEVHGYEVLEHYGRQGDFISFFEHFYDIWRVLKPGGYLCATTPMWDSPWAWGDPGHTRIVSRESLIFLDRKERAQRTTTAMSDYDAFWHGDFEPVAIHEKEHMFGFILKAHKPVRDTA